MKKTRWAGLLEISFGFGGPSLYIGPEQSLYIYNVFFVT